MLVVVATDDCSVERDVLLLSFELSEDPALEFWPAILLTSKKILRSISILNLPADDIFIDWV